MSSQKNTTFRIAATNIALTILLFTGCATPMLPVQPDMGGVAKHYHGEPLPIAELARVSIPKPVYVKINGHIYSDIVLALLPGEHVLTVWYSSLLSRLSSEPMPLSVNVEKNHLYVIAAGWSDGLEGHMYILDITGKDDIRKILYKTGFEQTVYSTVVNQISDQKLLEEFIRTSAFLFGSLDIHAYCLDAISDQQILIDLIHGAQKDRTRQPHEVLGGHRLYDVIERMTPETLKRVISESPDAKTKEIAVNRLEHIAKNGWSFPLTEDRTDGALLARRRAGARARKAANTIITQLRLEGIISE